jgi:hypothetical protein
LAETFAAFLATAFFAVAIAISLDCEVSIIAKNLSPRIVVREERYLL